MPSSMRYVPPEPGEPVLTLSIPIVGIVPLQPPKIVQDKPTIQKPQGDFVGCKWIADRTGWSMRTVRRMARQRLIPGASHQGHGGHWRFKRSVAQAWLASAT